MCGHHFCCLVCNRCRRSITEGLDEDNNTPTVEGNNDAGKQDSDDNKNSNTDDKNEDDKKAETPTVEITKNGELDLY